MFSSKAKSGLSLSLRMRPPGWLEQSRNLSVFDAVVGGPLCYRTMLPELTMGQLRLTLVTCNRKIDKFDLDRSLLTIASPQQYSDEPRQMRLSRLNFIVRTLVTSYNQFEIVNAKGYMLMSALPICLNIASKSCVYTFIANHYLLLDLAETCNGEFSRSGVGLRRDSSVGLCYNQFLECPPSRFTHACFA
jgi:hypothetical protein